MTTRVDLNSIEKKVWTSYFEDGLWDAFMGLLMLSLGIGVLTDGRLAGYGLLALGVLLLPFGRRLVTYPRIGRVKFGHIRRKKQRKVMFIVSFCVILGLFGFLMGALDRNPDIELPDAMLGVFVGIFFFGVFSSLAYFMEFGRLYAYGLLLAISVGLTEALDNSVGPILLCVSGAATVLIGFVITCQFIRKYPRINSEDSDSNA